MKNFNRIKKIIPLIAITIIMASSAWTVTYAVEDYTLLAPLPGISKTSPDCVGKDCKTDLNTYLPAVFNFGIGLAAAMAFVMITLGGITYATSDAVFKKSHGREWIENAIWGLLLVIGAWVILNTINPQILKFDLSLPKPKTDTSKPTVVAGGSCAGCVSLTSAGIPTKPGIGTNVAPALLGRLGELNGRLKQAGISWQVTEGHPPKVIHQNPCHQKGSCVDANFNGTAATPANIEKFALAAKNSGLTAIYEVKTAAEKKALVDGGARSARIDVVPQISAPHFSVYP